LVEHTVEGEPSTGNSKQLDYHLPRRRPVTSLPTNTLDKRSMDAKGGIRIAPSQRSLKRKDTRSSHKRRDRQTSGRTGEGVEGSVPTTGRVTGLRTAGESSATGREGRQLTVGNVGTNGRIYLT
jgi:hypothetical protein